MTILRFTICYKVDTPVLAHLDIDEEAQMINQEQQQSHMDLFNGKSLVCFNIIITFGQPIFH